ncbi:hypothetical protein GQ44DRAFT_828176 [Phaeosphaeriaceae sp. PMI808]|nr:hypothetical protein GQ44DRAFT_828176 [Phaeosphaeriaceae sp. PMI808]
MMLHQCFSWLKKSRGLSAPHKIGTCGETEKLNEDQKKRTEEYKNDQKPKKPESVKEMAEEIALAFEFSDDSVARAVKGFLEQMNEGLHEHGCAIEQLPSFINEIPNGREKGTYLAIDLGGTNMRICSVKLNGDGTYSSVQDKSPIPTALMSSTSEELFSWIARKVQWFLQINHSEITSNNAGHGSKEETVFDLGFTFSHAVHQQDINRGTLIRWSKGFDIDGALGQDICTLLQTAFQELAIPVRVKALINDTVGTLLAQGYGSSNTSNTVIGAVFGTGTNGAYIEQLSKITKLDGPNMDNKGIMVVNSEWGNFDPKLEFLPVTSYDSAVDIESVNPGFEMFEKRISGMYLGELLRLAILSLNEDHRLELLTGSKIPKTSRLYVKWGLDTSLMSALEGDTGCDLSYSKTQIEEWIGVTQASFELTQAIRIIAQAIGRRSARLSAVALGAVIVQTGCLGDNFGTKDRIDIGVDGSLVELYPGFIAEIRRTLKLIGGIGETGETRIDIAIAKNGSAVGAALAAHFAASASNIRIPATTTSNGLVASDMNA